MHCEKLWATIELLISRYHSHCDLIVHQLLALFVIPILVHDHSLLRYLSAYVNRVPVLQQFHNPDDCTSCCECNQIVLTEWLYFLPAVRKKSFLLDVFSMKKKQIFHPAKKNLPTMHLCNLSMEVAWASDGQREQQTLQYQGSWRLGLCHFLPCDAMLSVVCAIVICLSVTLRYCIKTAKHRITQIMPAKAKGL